MSDSNGRSSPGVRSSPRLAAAALAREAEANGADVSSSSTLQVPSTSAAPTARRSVSFGPTIEEPNFSTPKSEANASGNVSQQSATSTTETSDAAVSSMQRSDSAKRRARISGEIDRPGSERTILPAATAGSSSGPAGSGSMGTATQSDLASIAMATGLSSSGSTGSSTGAPSSPIALKPALKQGIQSKRLPPHGQYQHPDPLLRRLRLADNKGQPVDLRDVFKGVKVVAFYFSSQWAGQPLKEYHQTISELAREHPSELRVIYVSVDVDEQWYKAGVKGQPWISMVWNDGSSLPSPGVTNATSPSVPTNGTDSASDPPPLHNNEDFLLAQELDIDESLAKTDTSGEAYLRPFSRVHLASKLNILAAPTLCVYHIERQRMLDWNVRVARLHRSRRDETFARWRRGEAAKHMGVVEALSQSPVTTFLLIFALVYWAMLLIGGKDWNLIRRAIERADPSRAGEQIQKYAEGGGNAQGHVEF